MIFEILSSGVLASVIAGAVAWVTTSRKIELEREKLKRSFQLQFATEVALKTLLETDDKSMRSFGKIQHHLKGFQDENELRRHLIQAGAVHFTGSNGEELWGLLEKHKGAAFK